MLSAVFAITLSLPARAHRPVCDARLGVPLAHAKHFADFADEGYLTPLRWYKLVARGNMVKLELASAAPEERAGRRATASCMVHLFGPAGWRRMTFERIVMDTNLDPDFTYRTMLSHLLTHDPAVNVIDFSFCHTTEEGRLRGAFARGINPERAIRATDAYRALAAFGFRYKEYRLSIPDGMAVELDGEAEIDVVVTRPVHANRSR